MHLLEQVQESLATIGFFNAQIVQRPNDIAGDGVVIFRIGSLLLRFVRDRGQDFLDIASMVEPTIFHQFDDIEIAMGWRSVEDILAKQEPESLSAVLEKIEEKFSDLNAAMSGERERFTRAQIERAAKQRGEAFVESLR